MTDRPQIQSPGEFIKQELDSRGWTQADLAKVLDRPLPTVNRILNGKHAILPDMAIVHRDGISATVQRFGCNARPPIGCRWPGHQLMRAFGRRARLFDLVPIKDVQKREWITTTDDLDALEREVCWFVGIKSLDDDATINVATRRTSVGEPLTPQQFAWCCRVRQLASSYRRLWQRLTSW